ncbi:MAG: GNAT family N-acetyltransferase [Pyrinomonadaceae bacterium]|nr:GNAT family N-acetyltransferase [Pyrinomonadaceae bacterium]
MHDYLLITALPNVDLLAQWEDLLSNAPHATHYVTPDFFVDPFAGKGERFAIFAVEGGRIDGVLTGLKIGGKIVSGLAVRPQTAFRSGIDTASAASALARGIASMGGDLVTFHSWHALRGLERLGYVVETAAGGDQVVMLDLTKGPETLFKGFTSGRRTDIRKALRVGELDVKLIETDDEIAELYELHKDWNGRKGFAPDSFDDFRNAALSKHRATFIATCNGKIVAGSYFRFTHAGVVEYAANNSLAEFQHLQANKLIVWKAIEWACANGFAKFSLGASHPFLTRFGGEIVSTYRYQLDRTFLRVHANRERAMRLAVKTFQALPEPVRQRIKAATARV